MNYDMIDSFVVVVIYGSTGLLLALTCAALMYSFGSEDFRHSVREEWKR